MGFVPLVFFKSLDIEGYCFHGKGFIMMCKQISPSIMYNKRPHVLYSCMVEVIVIFDYLSLNSFFLSIFHIFSLFLFTFWQRLRA